MYPPCPFLYLTGFYCPGCGALRALHALLHLHWREAFALNPLVTVFAPVLVVYFATLPLRRMRPLPAPVYYLTLGGILLFGILRNLKAYPFTLLAPH